MIKSLSSYYITIPFVSPLTSATCTSYTIKLYIWSGEKASVPAELAVTATSEEGVIMGVEHKSAPMEGVQFHPESVLTEGGHHLLANWLTEVGDTNAFNNLKKIQK